MQGFEQHIKAKCKRKRNLERKFNVVVEYYNLHRKVHANCQKDTRDRPGRQGLAGFGAALGRQALHSLRALACRPLLSS